MANIKLINHSSVLIQDGDSFILTDPWYARPAFGSWLPTPPMSVHPVYLVALAKNNTNFNILISHGHDDHLDEDFLSLFPKDVSIIIPEYKSKGLRKRLERVGLKNINEVSSKGKTFGKFVIKSYINELISRDDAILTIGAYSTSNNFIIHANDNWQELEGEILHKLKKDAENFTSDQILYMSQCNLADGFPSVYRNYTKDEKLEIHNNRVNNIISTSLLNANKLNAKYFLNYAGHAAAFVKNNIELRNKTSYISNAHVQEICNKFKYSVEVLNIIPGDSFDFCNIQKHFPGIDLCDNALKKESYSFYEKYNKIAECDSYKEYNSLSKKDLLLNLDYFLNNFRQFVEPRLGLTNFNTDIIGCKIIFSTLDLNAKSEIVVGGPDCFDGRVIEFFTPMGMLSAVITGKINWENLYIGYGTEIETTPKDINIRAVVRWLAMYGYFYQRLRRQLPSLASLPEQQRRKHEQ